MAVTIIRNNCSEVLHGCSGVTSSGAHMNRKTYNDISLLTVLCVGSVKYVVIWLLTTVYCSSNCVHHNCVP